MPFNTEQIAAGQLVSLDHYVRNRPAVDQINIAHPLFKKLNASKQEWSGGLQYIVEQLRKSNDSNFQPYFGDSEITFNRKRTIDQSKFTWGNVFDGFALNEDEFRSNGIKLVGDKAPSATDNEMIQLTNLLDENNKALVLGFEENLDLAMHRSNSAQPLLPPGLDHLIQTDPSTSSVVGTINQATNTWWRNYAKLNISPASLIGEMETAWLECIRYGGSRPDMILVGTRFLHEYRQRAGVTINRNIFNGGNSMGGVSLDAGTTEMYFKGVELIWDPVMDQLDSLDAPAVPWAARAYFINSKHLKLRPIEGSWMVKRQPPMVYNRFVHYFGLTGSYAMTTNKRRAHAVLALYA